MIPETTPAPATDTPVTWQDDQPFSPRYGDRYHTRSGARAQAEHVFLGGCGLPGAWSGSRETGGPELDDGALRTRCPGDDTPPHTNEGTRPIPSGSAVPKLDGGRRADAAMAASGSGRPPACWTILETGFGLGLNFLSTWAAWRASPQHPTTLRFVSTEAHPVTARDIRRAAQDDPLLLPLAERLADAWPDTATLAAWYPGNGADALPCHAHAASGPPTEEGTAGWHSAPTRHGKGHLPLQPHGSAVPGVQPAAEGLASLSLRFPEPGGVIELRLLLGDAATSLQAWQTRHGSLGVDSVFLDGFDPKKNPALWNARTMQAVAAHCRPGARIATWCVARSVRDALTEAGFRLHRRPGLPPKRHCLAGEWPNAPSRA